MTLNKGIYIYSSEFHQLQDSIACTLRLLQIQKYSSPYGWKDRHKVKTVYPLSFGPGLYKYLYPLLRNLSSDNAWLE